MIPEKTTIRQQINIRHRRVNGRTEIQPEAGTEGRGLSTKLLMDFTANEGTIKG
jgi:hypothetical protein